ncbi:Uncharacterised protein [BD1-7 clade bacterium]|uniref:Replicative helicase inhibitor G39P N-terminal domain-containing protein n=1 Tax=BD1-7 clade bacterium TaxID=2029982 RepID=A0A5S9QCL5_9GAMM|nr:Uncharacterised protein [BD1-7 clade bacterium]
MIDAINRVFAEFELVYHNQYTKAFPTLEKLQYAKKLWFSNLRQYRPDQIVHAAHQAIRESEYLPTIRGLLKYCDSELDMYGLPEAHAAYIEACKAPSPKAGWHWSHAAVYHAGKATGWFTLANQTEFKAFPLFETHYQQLCTRVRRGETLPQPKHEALPKPEEHHMSRDDQLDQMHNIMDQLKD